MGSELKKLFQPTATEQLYLKHYYHEQEKELPADNPYFFPLVLVRHVTETDNLHTQVTQRTNSRSRQKTIKIVKL